jgi:benzoyl-CoA reductase/2-hydroxyglutaryl-CoA dehydratase subunit BcrC/BadD/HgdB
LESVKPFLEWLGHYPEKIRTLAHEIPAVGYFCTYTPVELIRACGFLPIRISGESGPVQKAYTLAPTFICLYMRRALEKALEGKYDFLSGVVQGYTCDVACGLTNIWEENIRLSFYHTLPLPYNQSEAARAFYRSIFLELIQKLEAHGGRFSSEALSEALKIYERIRGLLTRLYERRYQGRLDLPAEDLLAVVLAGFVMPPETFLGLLEALVEELNRREARSPIRGFPVLVSGSLIEDLSVLRHLETLGIRVVADDLCTGLRSFYPPADDNSDERTDPLDRLIDRTIRHFPCPSRQRAKERFPLLLDLVRRSGAGGVIFLLQKFCTPHLAAYPLLSEAFKKEGLPHILLEREDSGLTEAHRTRLEAFVEIYGRR